MVTGGFKVWHIIFIIIAFIVTMIVIYCCFHRCRIPRTKQEIEADLMRSNLGNKFRDYLQELPNEPFTFTEALKKVQEIEEKLEQDDAQLSRELGARKRMGWIKLKGKEKEAEKDKDKLGADKQADETINQEKDRSEAEPSKANGTQLSDTAPLVPPATGTVSNQTNKSLNGQLKISDAQPAENSAVTSDEAKKESMKGQLANKTELEHTGDEDKPPTKPASTRRRRQKPNLSRTKLAKERPLLVESSDNLERPVESSSHLEIPEPTSRRQNPTKTHKKKLKLKMNEPKLDTRTGDH